MSEQNNKAGLLQKIANVYASSTLVVKGGFNPHFKYKYVTEADILEMIRPLLVENRLLVLPTTRRTETRGNEGGNITELEIDFEIFDIDTGESVVCTFVGEGQDKGDKGAYKAYTGAVKYFLMKTFGVPTGDDPEVGSDADKEQVEANKPRTTPSANGRFASPPQRSTAR